MLPIFEDPSLTIFGFSIVLPLVFSVLAKPSSTCATSPAQPLRVTSPRASETIRRRRASTFPLESLPTEIVVIILSMVVSANAQTSTATYHKLLFVSRRIHRLTCPACLPFVDVHIQTSEALNCFHRFIMSDEARALSVRRLRIDPFIPLSAYEEDSVCVYLIRSCKDLEFLACHARTLEKAIIKRQPFVHKRCRHVVARTGEQRVDQWLGTPSWEQLKMQVTCIDIR